jgi:hypothetical protein
VPYVFTDRVSGESKLNQGEILNYLRQLGRIYRSKFSGNGRSAKIVQDRRST